MAEPRGFWRTSWRRRMLALEALWQLVRARIDTLRPAAHYTRVLGRVGAPPPDATEDDTRAAAEIGHVVKRVADVMPFRAVCLQQAIAVRRMLNRRGLPATVHLGLARTRTGDNVRDAHAWVTTGSRVVSGWTDLDRYAVVGTFS